MSPCLEGVKEYCIGLTMPFSLEDGSKGSRTYPLTQSDLTLRDFPVVTGVPSPQGFLFTGHSVSTITQTMTFRKMPSSVSTSHHFIAVLR